jgi:uncharacterized protein YfdQ (DUF2303 family)
MSETPQTEYEAAYNAGAGTNVLGIYEGVPVAIIPPGYTVEAHEELLTSPLRQRASASLSTVDSFILYVNKFGSANKQLFANTLKSQVDAILDYHAESNGAASWCTHCASLSLQLSQQWQTWKSRHGRAMSQVEFAEFLEDNCPDIVEPDGAAVLEAASSLEANKTVKFKSGVNLSNGTVQITYDEQVEGKGKGQIIVPARFILGIPVFEGNDPIPVNARLRFRIKDDVITFTYLLDKPERILKDAFDLVLKHIEEGTEIKPFLGSVSV